MPRRRFDKAQYVKDELARYAAEVDAWSRYQVDSSRKEGETMSEMKERLLESERKYQEGYFNTYYGHWQEGYAVKKEREENEMYEHEKRREAQEREEIAAGIRNPDGFLNFEHPSNMPKWATATKTIGKKQGSKSRPRRRTR